MSTLPQCPKCGSRTSHPRGSHSRPDRYQCDQCNKYFTDKGSPKVLVFDIETLPAIGTFWGTGKQYISYENILEDYVVLSWSAKSLFDSHVLGDILTPEELQRRLATVFVPDHPSHDADYRILKRIWKLLDEADVVITQNGKKFDVKKLNARFIYYGFPPPRPYHHIDTLEACFAVMAPSSAKLGYMTKWLGLPRKMDTDYQLWLDCQRGDPTALKNMYQYGLNDTLILEDYYALIRAWIPNHPNFSVYTNKYVNITDTMCPVCRQVIEKKAINGIYRTPLGNEYDSFRCPHCGTIGRKSKKNPGTPFVRRAG
jgi:hypothetical protein